MPRANRFRVRGAVWHVTHRCHDRSFLLKFERDRRRWRRWLFEARKRYGLCVLNYVATSNHVHLLVVDQDRGEIARSMQLAAGRTAQEYNRRKGRKGAFWEDRYFATAVASDRHLVRCLVYLDLNMVRAGAVGHPAHWSVCGYNEIQSPPCRYRLIDRTALQTLTGMHSDREMQLAHKLWVESALSQGPLEREIQWTQSIAVGPKEFVTSVKAQLGPKAYHRSIRAESADTYRIEDAAT